ncbi:MAG: hypothetical protein ACRDMZ_04005, partial [Solirubrobacteraceae bacterium]
TMSLLGILGGALKVAKNVVPGAAAARAGYLEGQEREEDRQHALERQSLLDKMEARLKESQIHENEGRQHYYDSVADSKANPDVSGTWKPDAAGEFRFLPSKMPSGSAGAHAGSAHEHDFSIDEDAFKAKPVNINGPVKTDSSTPLLDQVGSQLGVPPGGGENRSLGAHSGVNAPTKPTKGPSIHRSGVLNLANGMFEDVYSDGSRKPVRKATAEELAKANRVPGAGGASGGARPMNDKTKESLANQLADRAIAAANGDPYVAAHIMEGSSDYPKAKEVGLNMSHYAAAARRYRDRATTASQRATSASDRHAESVDRLSDPTAPKPAPATAPTAAPTVSP